jgi:putative hydrolase of the HAD superfamily
MKTKYLLLDVANTLLYKPYLFKKILETLNQHHYKIDIEQLIYNHKVLSECILFPDKTSEQFYNYFNSELLLSLGICPQNEILDDIYKTCRYLSWEQYNDIDILNGIGLPIGLLSNWDRSLKDKIEILYEFDNIFCSEEIGLKKPDPKFFIYVVELLNLNPGEILYVGDSLKLDIFPANKLGFKTVLIDRMDFYKYYNGDKVNSFNNIKNFINI